MRTLITSTVDEINQYKLGNVTTKSLIETLKELTERLELSLEMEHEFEFTFYNSDEPLYILHNKNYFDPTMLSMLVEFEVDIKDIKEWSITKL